MITLGRVAGHRGATGEITVKIAGGDAAIWDGLRRVRLETADGVARDYTIEASRAYADRLVLKLCGVEQADAAAELRGARVVVSNEDAPELSADQWFAAELVGLEVVDESDRVLGTIDDVMPTGGTDLLIVKRAGEAGGAEDELLIPLAREIVLEIRAEAGNVLVRLPEGLLELNRADEKDAR